MVALKTLHSTKVRTLNYIQAARSQRYDFVNRSIILESDKASNGNQIETSAMYNQVVSTIYYGQ